MPRPRKCRIVNAQPGTAYFKPRGVPMRQLTEVYLPLEGFEALRLADYEGLKHEEGAKRMDVSRQTFGRILAHARHAVTEALVYGMALRIEGGEHVLIDKPAADLPEAILAAVGDRKNPIGQTVPVGTDRTKPKGDTMSKIAISSEGPSLDDAVDPRFGRAAGFLVVDTDTESFEYLDNGASQVRAQGAGIQAAETVARSGAKIVLTGYVGPKAFMALEAAGVKVGQDLGDITVREALAQYKAGRVKLAQQPNKAGHWS